ncbi:hypothetical protein CK556_01175 [Mesoplasma chauliocola]|uniref:Uncharacterized protein n=1 Tax=Mesoplasma chauliocola TaxID=216427 RepID=A0A249SMX5_9MOLU|nr:hypothetical protein [Mesoplasma chauliocola]ASZ08968.1 hypothetical protein CK556_01175 [Mesoplasma chauliocola]
MDRKIIIGLTVLLIGLAIAIIFAVIAFLSKKSIKKHDDFNTEKKRIGMWDFTKQNLPLFISLFGLIISLTGIVLLIN